MKLFYSDTFELPLPDYHRSPMSKDGLLRERIVDEGIVAPDELHGPDAVAWDDLLLVHDAAYVDAVAGGTLPAEAQRAIGFPWSPMMVERSRRSVGATLAAARAVLKVRLKPDTTDAVYAAAANLAGGTHHAFRDRGEGYCVFNDVAVTAAVLLRDGQISRAAVVDCDVHQGNGTASIFRDEPAVFIFSLHGAKNVPFRKEISDLDGHRPELVFYLAGNTIREAVESTSLALSHLAPSHL
jgi:acetoin utilization deacetylase AcuC-like enzyme